MKLFKRITAAMLSLTAIAFTLVGCAAGASSGGADGEISVFYYTFSDAYISTVRSAMNGIFKESGRAFNDYDANGNQTTQTEQVQTALAKGSKMLIVNVVDTGSNDAAQHIVDLAGARNVPVIFFNRSVDESVVESYEKCVFVGTDYEQAGHIDRKSVV